MRDLVENEAEMRAAFHAYLVLTDPELRSAYDARRSMAKINADLARRLEREAMEAPVQSKSWSPSEAAPPPRSSVLERHIAWALFNHP